MLKLCPSIFFFLLLAGVSRLQLVQSSPILRSDSYAQQQQQSTFVGSSEFTPWHNETRNRPMIQRISGVNVGNSSSTPANSSSSSLTTSAIIGGSSGVSSAAKCNLVPSYLCFTEAVQSYRDREMRLMAIKQYILSTLGHGKSPTATATQQQQIMTQQTSEPQLSHQQPQQLQMGQLNPNPTSSFPGKLQTFEASCELPPAVDVEAWTGTGLFHIFFNISTLSGPSMVMLPTNDLPITTTTPPPQPYNPFQPRNYGGSTATASGTAPSPAAAPAPYVNVVSAKLKLYKKGTETTTGSNLVQPSSARVDAANNLESPTSSSTLPARTNNNNNNLLNYNLPMMVDERIRVSIYWYTIPVSKHHYKKKLLDTKMLSIKDAEWVEFDVQKAVKDWVENDSNFGLTIEVENEDDDLINPARFFTNVICPSSNSTSSFMSRTVEPVSVSAPILDIYTVSVPASQLSTPSSFMFPIPDRQNAIFSHSNSRGRFPSQSHVSDDETTVGGRFPWQNDRTATNGHRRRHHHGESSSNNNHNNLRSSSNENTLMQADDATNVETTTKFELDPNHPLRHIFATASSKIGRNSRNSNRRKYFRHSSPVRDEESNDNNAGQISWDDGGVDVDDDNNNNNQVRRVIIENIFVEPSSSSSTSTRQLNWRTSSRDR